MENILTLDQMDDIFAEYVTTALDLQPEQVRISYMTTGQPAPAFGETVIYIHSSQEQDEIQQYKNRHTEKTEEGFNTEQSSMRRLSVAIAIYGTYCSTMAIRLKEKLYLNDAREWFYRHNLSLIPNRIEIINTVHEYVDGRWWERVDLTIGLYNSVTLDEFAQPFAAADIRTEIS